ncbi:hypothetical protein G7Y79_00010g028390 [Physcia stellaris]|nr:hypothetical protein G7Y79_00010g028390 [Physcia stellaris]
MASYYSQPQQPPSAPYNPQQNLQFYPSSYPNAPVSGHTTPSQAQYGNTYGQPSSSYPSYGGYGAPGSATGPGFGQPLPSGRMGEQGGLRTGWLAAFGTEGPPSPGCQLSEMLKQANANLGQTLTVLNPLAPISQHIMDDSDLAGPILFFLLFGTFLLFSGKVHFGYIYGLALVGSLSLHTIFSLMSPPPNASPSTPGYHPSPSYSHTSALASTLTFLRSASVLGYCLLPLVATSAVGVVLPMDTAVGYALTSVAIGWCTYSSSGMFCAVGRMSEMRGLVAYPLALFYAGFGIMGIFSSKGAGTLVAKVT